jgi:hypothetical protein
MNNWVTIAPILEYFDENEIFDNPFYFDSSLSIQKKPNWITNDDLTKYMSYYQKEIVSNSKIAFIMQYQANALGDPAPEWYGDSSRSIQDVAAEKIYLAILALWLSKPTLINVEILIHAEERDGTWSLRQSFMHQAQKVHGNDICNQMEADDLNLAKLIYEKILVTKRDSSVWVAISSIFQALQASWGELRFLMFCIALEALFGTNTELTYRLSLRISMFAEDNKTKQRDLFEIVKKIYKERGKVVHGRGIPGKNDDDRSELMKNTEDIIRKTTIKIIIDDTLRTRFSSSERERYLDDIPFK